MLKTIHPEGDWTLNNPAITSVKENGSWELNLDRHLLTWSPAQYRLYGYEPNELVLNDEYFIINTTHPSDIERITAIIHEALRHDEGYSFKRRIIKKDGSLGFVQTEARIIRSKQGIPNKIIGVTSDVKGIVQQGICDYNDPAFFNKFYEDYKKTISVEICKLTFDADLAKDLCQEVFLKAWNHMSKYDPTKGTLYTWLINIARNHCKDYLRSKYFRCHQITQSIDRTPDELLNSDIEEARSLCTTELLLKLPIAQREVIELIFMQGFTQEEVAALKKSPIGTVKTRSRTAIQKLRTMIAMQESSTCLTT